MQTCKRVGDLATAALLLLLLAPLLLVIAVAVKLDTPGPVLFRQQRVGRERVGRVGRPFTMWKFRSMVVDAEQLLASLPGADGPLFKLADDPRITRVGRWLRRTSVDELPQLWNVIIGDMSLVGPRPALPREVATYTTRQRGRLAVRPGITGLWQVKGRSTLPFRVYVELDLFYVRRLSVWQDLAILARTIPAVLTARGAS